jgi:thiol:disulfide interchange protein DsbD
MGVKYMTLFLAFLINAFALAEPLEIEKAFKFTVQEKKNVIKISFMMNKGYYLYKEKFKFILDGEIIESKIISWPLSENFDDPNFGVVQVFKKSDSLYLSIDNVEKKHTLVIYFQGCTQDGFCYIPFKKEISL